MKDIDRQIAKKVMGWKFIRYSTTSSIVTYKTEKNEEIYGDWQPSTNIAHAWQVVEKLASRNIFISLMDQLGYDEKTNNYAMWRVEFMDSAAQKCLLYTPVSFAKTKS